MKPRWKTKQGPCLTEFLKRKLAIELSQISPRRCILPRKKRVWFLTPDSNLELRKQFGHLFYDLTFSRVNIVKLLITNRIHHENILYLLSTLLKKRVKRIFHTLAFATISFKSVTVKRKFVWNMGLMCLELSKMLSCFFTCPLQWSNHSGSNGSAEWVNRVTERIEYQKYSTLVNTYLNYYSD